MFGPWLWAIAFFSSLLSASAFSLTGLGSTIVHQRTSSRGTQLRPGGRQAQRDSVPRIQASAAWDVEGAAASLGGAIGEAASAPPVTFEPDFSLAAPSFLALGVSIAVGWFWWYKLVPGERVALSRSKRKGELGAYLGDLEADRSPGGAGERRVESWFFTDWLEQRKRKFRKVPQGEVEPFFLSTDNPVVVAGVLIGSGVMFSLLTGR